MNVCTNYIVIHQIVELLQLGTKNWTDPPTDRAMLLLWDRGWTVFRALTQYLVEEHLALIAALSLIGYYPTSLALDLGIFCHLSSTDRFLQICPPPKLCQIGLGPSVDESFLGGQPENLNPTTELPLSHSCVVLCSQGHCPIGWWTLRSSFPAALTCLPVLAPEKHSPQVLCRWWMVPGFRFVRPDNLVSHSFFCKLEAGFYVSSLRRGFCLATYEIMEDTLLLETSNAVGFFFATCPRSVPEHSPFQAVSVTSWLGFCSDIHCQLWDLTLYRQLWAFPNHIHAT